MAKSIIKTLYWELREREKRFAYINSFLTNIPGKLGLWLREKIIPGYFAEAGTELTISEGIKYRGAENIRMGNGVGIGIDNFLQATAGITFSDNARTGPGVKIWTVNHRFDDLDQPIQKQGYDLKAVSIGERAWIGANSFIMPGVELGEGCIVSAGSVVGAKKYPPYSIIAGNPARVIGNRKKQMAEKK